MFGNLSPKSCNYDELAKALEGRFAPPNQTELYRVQLKERRQKAAETLTELGQDIWRLTNLAYATAPVDVRETLAKEQFIDCLHSSDMRLRIKQARPKSLNDAVRHAVELEAFNKAEKKHEGQGFKRSTTQKQPDSMDIQGTELKPLQKSLQAMLEEATKRYHPRSKSDTNQPSMIQRDTGQRTNTPQWTKRKCSTSISVHSLKHIIRGHSN